VGEHISCMGVLNDSVKYLPMLQDSTKAAQAMKKGNISFNKADLGCHHTGICPNDVAQPVQSGPSHGSSEMQSKMIIMGHQIYSCHVPVVRSFFILQKMFVIILKFSI
jgi:hypothetical protein